MLSGKLKVNIRILIGIEMEMSRRSGENSHYFGVTPAVVDYTKV